MEITDLFVDNQYVYFSRSPIANSNALGLVKGASRRISYRANFEKIERIEPVRDRQVVSVRNNRIYSVESRSLYETNMTNSSTRLIFTVSKGVLKDITFRPLSGDIAFVNDRGTHAFLGLFSQNTSTIQWIRPNADTAIHPAFSSDGRFLAWLSTYPSDEDVTAYSASDGNMVRTFFNKIS